jgi:AsmA family protein
MSAESPRTTDRGWRRHPVVNASLVLLVLLVVLIAAWDWNWLRGPIERRITAATGREFTIDGPLEVDLGRVTVIRLKRLALASPPWSLTPEMARAELVRAELPLAPLLRGERRLLRVDVVRPALLLERTRNGTANWQGLLGERSGKPSRWRVSELRIHDGLLAVRDVPFKTQLRLTVNSFETRPELRSVRLRAEGGGRYRGEPFRLDGWADSPIALLERPDDEYRIDVSARAGATRARLHGTLPTPVDPNHIVLLFETSGADLAHLYPLLGLALPSTPPYRLAGSLERDRRVLRLRRLQGRIGDSDVGGRLDIDLSHRKPAIEGRLVSSRLDLDDLGGLIGLPPGAGPGDTASVAQRAEAERRAASSRLLPSKDFDLRKLAAINADVELDARDIDAGKWPVRALVSRLRLQDSVLRLEPFDLGFAGGTLAGTLRLDARKPTIAAAAQLAARSLDLATAWPDMQPPNVGLVHGTIDLEGRGNSVADMLGTANGTVQFGMGRGRYSNLLLELAGLDVAESLKYLLNKEKTVPVRCAYAVFVATDGVFRAESLAFDTTDTVLFGSGKVDLGEESLALELRPEPKDVSPVSLRGPLEIKGTLKEPRFRPQAKPLLARAAAAAALYALAPPAALLALIETGPGEDIDCSPPDPPKDKR